MHTPEVISLIQRRNQELQTWMIDKQYSLKMLADAADLALPTFLYHLKNLTMPVERHRLIVQAYGVPSRLLPEPMDRRPGPKPLSAFTATAA